ncbi:hypothetical protein T492DRAFT_1108817 [Pavlovales sp. CCMP2436]|nr:hypothetical protein T492DRAFT_1108817 [Pavlovales sp. CCMP2436]|mmetsp:Transcript_33116/g.82383  ORF Transcript_33116/g.82383 Transcript_33116/m.82383 type:complete len:96 (-) Transcript_33116:266-553(-)
MATVLVVGSVGLLLNAMLDGIHHREYLRASHQSYARPPIEIVVQCVLALLVCTWAIVLSAPRLKPIRVSGTRDLKNFDFYSAVPGFMTFNHRPFR